MAAATADRLTSQKELGLKSYPVKAATKIYAGTLVAIDGSGWALPAADAANLHVVGVADVQADNAIGANGDVQVKVRRGVFRLPASSITQAMVGTMMYVVDDQTVDDVIGINGVKAGRLVEYVGAADGWVEILGGQSRAAVTADAAVTAAANAVDLATVQTLANDLKAKYNAAVALINELKSLINNLIN